MPKPKKFVKEEIVGQQLPPDSDELQLLDECNSEWADAWKATAKQKSESKFCIFGKEMRETKAVWKTPKKR